MNSLAARGEAYTSLLVSRTALVLSSHGVGKVYAERAALGDDATVYVYFSTARLVTVARAFRCDLER